MILSGAKDLDTLFAAPMLPFFRDRSKRYLGFGSFSLILSPIFSASFLPASIAVPGLGSLFSMRSRKEGLAGMARISPPPHFFKSSGESGLISSEDMPTLPPILAASPAAFPE